MAVRPNVIEQTQISRPLVCLLAWAIPGAGHLLLGKRRQGGIILGVVLFMFAFGLFLEGRIFRFEPGQPLVMLASLANACVGLAWAATRVVGWGAGLVTATTYEYGNAFLIVAGLLNCLVILDAYDVAMGRKS